jgi:hypothetical protein
MLLVMAIANFGGPDLLPLLFVPLFLFVFLVPALYNQAALLGAETDRKTICRDKKNEAGSAAGWR